MDLIQGEVEMGVSNEETNPKLKEVLIVKDQSHVLQYFHTAREYDEKHDYKIKIYIYVMIILLYFGVNIAMLILNSKDQEFIEANYFESFHLIEFWAVFAFTVCEAYILISSGTVVFNPKAFNIMQCFILFCNIILTLAAALILSAYSGFERQSHFIEYTAQIVITLVNFFFLLKFNPSKKKEEVSNFQKHYFRFSALIIACTFIISVINILIYAEVILTTIEPERAAHFCEFIVELVNSIFALIYAMQVLKDVQDEIDLVVGRMEMYVFNTISSENKN